MDKIYEETQEEEVDYCQTCGGAGCGCPDCDEGLVFKLFPIICPQCEIEIASGPCPGCGYQV